ETECANPNDLVIILVLELIILFISIAIINYYINTVKI
ncbi:unnamed protein product, partial [marine sediment metagenome]